METNHSHNKFLNNVVKAMRQAHTHEVLSSVFSCEGGSVVIVKDVATGEEFTLKMTIYKPTPIQKAFEILVNTKERQVGVNRIKGV